ncbi:MAG: hypothetical protein AAFQ71_08450 [Planctomycetota bacterium]
MEPEHRKTDELVAARLDRDAERELADTGSVALAVMSRMQRGAAEPKRRRVWLFAAPALAAAIVGVASLAVVLGTAGRAPVQTTTVARGETAAATETVSETGRSKRIGLITAAERLSAMLETPRDLEAEAARDTTRRIARGTARTIAQSLAILGRLSSEEPAETPPVAG